MFVLPERGYVEASAAAHRRYYIVAVGTVYVLVSILEELVRHVLRFGVYLHVSGFLVVDPVLGDAGFGVYLGSVGLTEREKVRIQFVGASGSVSVHFYGLMFVHSSAGTDIERCLTFVVATM